MWGANRLTPLALTEYFFDRVQRAENEVVVDVQVSELCDLLAAFFLVGDGCDNVSSRNVLQQGFVFVIDDKCFIIENGGVGNVHVDDNRSNDFGENVTWRHHLQ